jgi:hypothetical protein
MTYTVIYRTGGTERFKWNRMLDTFTTHAAATLEAEDVERMGYRALVYNTAKLDAIGMPETYGPPFVHDRN